MYDPTEAREKGITRPKPSTRHPYAAIEHRVLDSAAYADLGYAARSVLQLFSRQLTKENNGHLLGAISYMSRFGIGSPTTLSNAIKELISHGMIYRTRCGGYQNGASLYAVTWLSIKKTKGLFVEGFQPCAWRYWEPGKNSPPQKMNSLSYRNGICSPLAHTASVSDRPPKNEHTELMPVAVEKAA